MRKACRLLKARRQGYYEYQARKGSPREVRDRCLTVKIKNIFYESNRIYGSRKIRAELRKSGECVSRKRVRRLIRLSENDHRYPRNHREYWERKRVRGFRTCERRLGRRH